MNDAQGWARSIKVREDRHVAEALAIEPELGRILDEATFQEVSEDYDHAQCYDKLKYKASRYVGDSADDSRIRTKEHYEAIIQAIDLLLPDDPTEIRAR